MSTEIYVNSDNRVTLSGLTNQSDDSFVNDATVIVTLYNYTNRKEVDKDVAVDATGGLVDIPSSAHGFAIGDFVLLTGDEDYEAEYELQSGTETDSIEVTATYVAKKFTGREQLLKAVDNARALSMAYIAASDGNYAGQIPDTIKLALGSKYWAVVSASSGANNVEFKQTWKAVYKG